MGKNHLPRMNQDDSLSKVSTAELQRLREEYPPLDTLVRLEFPVSRETYLELIWPDAGPVPEKIDAELEASLPPFLRLGDSAKPILADETVVK